MDEIIAPLLTTEWGRKTGWGAMLALLLFTVVLLYLMVTTWRRDIQLIHKEASPTHFAMASNEDANLVEELPDQHIFGNAGLAQGAILPITSLQLSLVGVIKTEPEKFSRVIISERGKPAKVYQIGDVLTSGVKVYSITREGVVLENGGRLEKLPLQRSPLLFQGMPKPLLQDENTQEE